MRKPRWRHPDGPGNGSTSEPTDLTGDPAATVLLLQDTWAWRQRLVQEYEFGAGDRVRVKSTYQMNVSSRLLAPVLAAPVATARLLVPLATKEKRPLLALDIAAPEGGYLLSRDSIATVQVRYLSMLISNCASTTRRVLSQGADASLLEAICAHTPYKYREFLAAAKGNRHSAITTYLEEALGLAVHGRTVERCLTLCDDARNVLLKALDEPPNELSSSELPLLAIPLMNPRPRDMGDVRDIVSAYRKAILVAADDSSADASAFLEVLSEYGRRWELILDVTVPLDGPCTISISEDRPMQLSRKRTTQVIPLGEARTVHVEARLADAAIAFSSYEVQELDGRGVSFAMFDGLSFSSEQLAIYGAEPDRPYYVRLGISFEAAQSIRVTNWIITGLAILSVVVAAIIGGGHGDVSSGADLAQLLSVVAVPTTFAVIIALAREQTVLALETQRWARVTVAIAIVALWVVVLTRLVLTGLDIRWLP